MKKVNNLKARFSNILLEDYQMNREEIKEYWANKKQQEHYKSTKGLIASIGAGGVVGTTGVLIYDVMNNSTDLIIPICIVGGVSVLTTVVSLVKRNPYTRKEDKEIDQDYKAEKKAYKKEMKRRK